MVTRLDDFEGETDTIERVSDKQLEGACRTEFRGRPFVLS